MRRIVLLLILGIAFCACKKATNNNANKSYITIFDGEWLQDSAINNNKAVTYKMDTNYITYQITGTDFIIRRYKYNVFYKVENTLSLCTIKGDSVCFNGKGSYRYTITNGVLKLERTSSGDTFWGHLK